MKLGWLSRKRAFVTLFILLILLSGVALAAGEIVYIVTTEGAYAYHKAICDPISNSRHIVQVTIEEAIAKGRKPCKFCYQK